MLSIAICDDNPVQLKNNGELIQKYLKARPSISGRVLKFDSGRALLEAVEAQGGFDLYILDVIMPKLNGIEIGLKLREQGLGGEIIYLTVSRDYAADSYFTSAFFYLVLPVKPEQLFSVLDKAAEKLYKRRTEALVVRTPDGVRRILFDSILYVERAGRIVRYYCTEETVESITFQGRFREKLEPLLRDRRFFLCGASYVYNLEHVAAIHGLNVTMDNGSVAAIPQRLAAEFRTAWGKYWLKERS